jgi:predicted ArsR family transcriptional regulator
MSRAPLVDRIRGIAALDHPITRAAYRLLGERGEVSRDETSAAMGLARSVAAFHLDKLVDAGLADVRFERRTGRSGPGAGRTAKLYRRSPTEIAVSLPERRYDLAGELLAGAVERASDGSMSVERALHDTAVEAGRRIGDAVRADSGPGAASTGRRDALLAVLEGNGYEPRVHGDEVVLANCPFHALAEHHRQLMCGMNLDLIGGIVEGVAGEDLMTARLAPEAGYCCVRIAAS